mmetsp:Transcript_17533/g.26501  ORF Transcript_17533/g.26501 Transcript_17533/m.26501 type:complete len:87 (+) Transcript_17533:465-725(+)
MQLATSTWLSEWTTSKQVREDSPQMNVDIHDDQEVVTDLFAENAGFRGLHNERKRPALSDEASGKKARRLSELAGRLARSVRVADI